MAPAARKRFAKAIPDSALAWMARDLAAQARTHKVGLAALERALKTGASPGEAMVYGMLSAHARHALATIGRKLLTGLAQARPTARADRRATTMARSYGPARPGSRWGSGPGRGDGA